MARTAVRWAAVVALLAATAFVVPRPVRPSVERRRVLPKKTLSSSSGRTVSPSKLTLHAGKNMGRRTLLQQATDFLPLLPGALSWFKVSLVAEPGAVIQQAIASGVQYLMHALRQAFGQRDQDLATAALDKFFGLSRQGQKMSLAEYSVEFDTRYDEAQDRAGLQLNNVAKFYLWFKHSGLPAKTVDDIKLQVNGDFNRFDDAKGLALRLSPNRMENDNDIFYGDYVDDEYYDNDWMYDYEDDDPWWYGYGGYPEEDEWWDYDYDDNGYYWEEEAGWRNESQDEQPPATTSGANETADAENKDDAATYEEYYKGGKSKGKGGDGCFNCGSRWHMARDCPLPSNRGQEHGKGKTKGYAFGRKGKSKGKGYGSYRPYKGFGKSKGYGKYGGGKYGGRLWQEPLVFDFTINQTQD
eukprot:s920_g8.t1